MTGPKARFLALAWWKKALIGLAALAILTLVILFLVVIIRTSTVSSPASGMQLLTTQKALILVDDGKEMERAARLAGALKIPTVSRTEPLPGDNETFLQLHRYLMRSYPNVHSARFVRRDIVNQKSLLYTVTGSRPEKMPYMLTSHLDVVPANPESWEVPPFSGQVINDTYIYGRGALDDKGGVIGILEALEFMIGSGEQPLRSFFMAFGHDEEISGRSGANEICKELQRRGVMQVDFILDEGHAILHNVFPTDKNVALIGVTEKGALTMELQVNGTPGHSSFPPWESPLVILADAVSKLEKHKLPSMLGSGPERYTFEYLAPHVSFGYRMMFSNLWMFSGSLASRMEKVPQMNAMVRTTTAVTIFNSGNKNNVVPGTATAVVNHRIHPSQSVAEILEFDKKVIDDPRVQIKVTGRRDPHPESPFGPDDSAYQTIKSSIEQVFPNTVPVPGFMVANTDMGWYLNISTQIYRFFPSVMEPEDLSRYHGNNERISVQNFQQAVSFYYRIIKNTDLLIESAPVA